MFRVKLPKSILKNLELTADAESGLLVLSEKEYPTLSSLTRALGLNNESIVVFRNGSPAEEQDLIQNEDHIVYGYLIIGG